MTTDASLANAVDRMVDDDPLKLRDALLAVLWHCDNKAVAVHAAGRMVQAQAVRNVIADNLGIEREG